MRILYICTHNRCRSILSEAITNHLGSAKVVAASAGSQPVEAPHPSTLKYLAERGFPTEELNSKSWNDIGDFVPDVVVTVCDSAAGESCPLWLGDTPKIHWGLNDPSKIEDSEAEVAEAFYGVMDEICRRVEVLTALADKHPQKGAFVEALKASTSQEA